MFCKQCGKEIDEDSKFCKYCGHKLNENLEICIVNVVTHISNIIDVGDLKTSQELFNLLIKNGLMPGKQEVLESCKLYNQDNHFLANYFTDKLPYLKNGMTLYLIYDDYIKENFRDRRQRNYDDMICLYGCPNSKKNRK